MCTHRHTCVFLRKLRLAVQRGQLAQGLARVFADPDLARPGVGLEPLDEKMTEPALVHMVKAFKFKKVRRWDAAAAEFHLASLPGIPNGPRTLAIHGWQLDDGDPGFTVAASAPITLEPNASTAIAI